MDGEKKETYFKITYDLQYFFFSHEPILKSSPLHTKATSFRILRISQLQRDQKQKTIEKDAPLLNISIF